MKTLRTLVIAFALSLASFTPAFAQEKIVLTEPIVAQAVTEYSLRYYAVDLENERVLIELKANTGELKTIIYANIPAVRDAEGVIVTQADNRGRALIRVLNRTDFRTKSAEATLIDQLNKDKHVIGVVAGTPR